MTWFFSCVDAALSVLLAACWGLGEEENLIYIPPQAPKCLPLALLAVFLISSLCFCTFKFWDLMMLKYLLDDGSLLETAGVMLQSHWQWLWPRLAILRGASGNFFCQIRFCESIIPQILFHVLHYAYIHICQTHHFNPWNKLQTLCEDSLWIYLQKLRTLEHLIFLFLGGGEVFHNLKCVIISGLLFNRLPHYWLNCSKTWGE